jgi:hypothetical protein
MKYYTNVFETDPTTGQIVKKRIQTDEQKKAKLETQRKNYKKYYEKNRDKMIQYYNNYYNEKAMKIQQAQQINQQQQIDNNQSFIQIPPASEPIDIPMTD